MDRRDFLKATATATAAATVGSVTAAQAGPTSEPSATPGMTGEMRRWVLALPQSLDTLEMRTVVARLQHQLEAALPHTSLHLETTVGSGLEAVACGFADFYVGLDCQHVGAHPALPLFAGMALGTNVPAAAHLAWLRGPGAAFWTTALDSADVVAMPVAHTGPSPGLYTDLAFESGRDVRGLRFGVRGLAGEALVRLGADVAAGAADGQGAVAARGLVAAEPLLTPFESKAAWSYLPGLTPAGLSISLGARGSFWRRLPASERTAIENITRDVAAASLELAANRQETLAQVAAFRRWPMPTVMAKAFEVDLRAAMASVYDDLATRDPLARRVIESYRRFTTQPS